MSKTEPTTRRTYELPESLVRRLKHMAADTKDTVQGIIVKAAFLTVERHEKKRAR